MKYLSVIFFLIIFFCLPIVAHPKTLTVHDVLKSVRQYYPKIAIADLKVDESSAKYRQALGVYDPKLGVNYERTEGYYGNNYVDAKISQYTPLFGSSIETGWRRGDGSFPFYDSFRETLSEGEYYFKFSVPLLRGGLTDYQRTKILNSKLGVEIAKNSRNMTRLQILADAQEAYISWYIKGHVLKQYQYLLAIAMDRQNAIQSRVDHGDSAQIEFDDNSRVILNREQDVNLAERDFLSSCNKLSLYWRDSKGNPLIPDIALLPAWKLNLSSKSLQSSENMNEWIQRHPLIEAVQKMLSQSQNSIRLAKNQRLPQFDLHAKVANDFGNGSSKLDQTEIRSGLTFSYPLLNRKARNEVVRHQLKLRRIEEERRLLENQLEVEIRNADMTSQKSVQRIDFAMREWRLAEKVEEAEKIKFASGDSGIFYVNLREEYTTKAKVAMMYAYQDYLRSLVHLQFASGGGFAFEF